MSAIWGCVDLNGEPVSESTSGRMREAFSICRIDRYEGAFVPGAAMGCGIQEICARARGERLPVRDGGSLFTADCMVDNTEELTSELTLERDAPWGVFLYAAWRRWGADCVKKVRGSFSFAAFDAERGMLTLAADHTSSRSLYYRREGSRVYFATVMEAIARGMAAPPRPCLDWLADYLALDSLAMITQPRRAAYEGVCKVEPGEYIEFTRGGERRTVYWNPLEMPELRLENDNAYRERFVSLMEQAAAEIADEGAQMGIYLSSGLDSTVVAALTAGRIKAAGRELYGYTSVPLPDYVNPRSGSYYLVDETQGVRALCEKYPNIIPHLCACEGVDALAAAPGVVRQMEFPMKSASNLSWMTCLQEQAAADGCRIMLSGQLGNLTISWGNIQTAAVTLLRQGHPLQALRSLNDYGKRLSLSRKRLFTAWLQAAFPAPAPRRPAEGVVLGKSLVNPAFARERGSIDRIAESKMYLAAPHRETFQENRKLRFNRNILSLAGESETKMGLTYGMVARDITKDKRIYEFCLNAPMECFVWGSRERRLVRDYMAEVLPPSITEVENRRGLQSADWVYRLMRRWPEVYAGLEKVCLCDALRPFIDTDRVRALLEGFRDGLHERDGGRLQTLFYLYMAGLFVERVSPAQF